MSSDRPHRAVEVPIYEVGGQRVAGFGIRLGAYLLDVIFLGIAMVVAVLLLGGAVAIGFSEGVGPLFLLLFGGVFFYRLICWTAWGATPGKMVLGLRIVSEDGEKIGFGKALLRFIGYFISEVIVYLGFIWIAIDRHNQGWHDKIAGTFVVHHQKEMLPAPVAQSVAVAAEAALAKTAPIPAAESRPDPESRIGTGVSQAKLVVIQGTDIGTEFVVRRSPITIGRAGSDNVQIVGDRHVSRGRVAMIFEGSSWKIEDHGARNPLQVNGNVVRAATLRNLDRVKLGETVLEFRID